MTLNQLREKVENFISQYKDSGTGPNENNIFDYKKELNLFGKSDYKPIDIFTRNLVKDILAFSNSDGGIIILGLKELEVKGTFEDSGLPKTSLEILSSLDINEIMQKISSITKLSVNVDLQPFNMTSRKYYYLLIEKQTDVVIPIDNFEDYKLVKGEIIYRQSGRLQTANASSQEFNKFLQLKAAEKNKEFMEIWTKLLPEMFDINPKEVLMINPKTSKIYGFNNKEGILSSSDIGIEKDGEGTGVFNIILQAIHAGDIGKISTNEGKPIYKIVGEVNTPSKKNSISISTFLKEVIRISKYKISNPELKQAMHFLNWVTVDNFAVENPERSHVNDSYSEYIWIELIDVIQKTRKVVFSKQGIMEVINLLDNKENHYRIYGKELRKK